MPAVRSRKRRPAQRIGLLLPFAGTQVTLGLGEFPHRAQQQAECGVGDLLVEHVRGVGDDDAVRAGPFGVDVVVADAEARHDLELGQPLHEVRTDLFGGVGDGERAHAIGHVGEERVAVLDVV